MSLLCCRLSRSIISIFCLYEEGESDGDQVLGESALMCLAGGGKKWEKRKRKERTETERGTGAVISVMTCTKLLTGINLLRVTMGC